jgi:hypothetical protein
LIKYYQQNIQRLSRDNRSINQNSTLMKTIIKFIFIFLLISYSCTNTQSVNASGGGSSKGLRGTAYDSGQDDDTNEDPDGITGNASTYGTGTGVSGQTAGGAGAGTGNTGRSGVGVVKGVKATKR